MGAVDVTPWTTVNADGCGVDDLSFCGAVEVTVAAETGWDTLVAATLAEGWVGLEWLSGRPGTVEAAVVGNHTAYGHSVGDSVARVRTREVATGRQRTYAAAECAFVPGRSRFLTHPGTHIVLDVTFLLRQGDLSAPIRDAAFAELAEVAVGTRLPAAEVRALLTARPEPLRE